METSSAKPKHARRPYAPRRWRCFSPFSSASDGAIALAPSGPMPLPAHTRRHARHTHADTP
eukprot:5624226-Pleurochrysis_carterae.AAC.1